MSELIDRQAAIEVIDAVFPVAPMKSEYAQGVACGAALAKTYVEQLPSAHPELNEWCHDCKEYDAENGCCPRWGNVIRTALEDAKPEQRWVSVSERLPEKDKEVLVCYDFKGHRFVLIGALYDDGKFYGYDDEYLTPEGRKYRKAVAWMPLPEPYKGEQE